MKHHVWVVTAGPLTTDTPGTSGIFFQSPAGLFYDYRGEFDYSSDEEAVRDLQYRLENFVDEPTGYLVSRRRHTLASLVHHDSFFRRSFLQKLAEAGTTGIITEVVHVDHLGKLTTKTFRMRKAGGL